MAYGLFGTGMAMGWSVSMGMMGENAMATMYPHQTGVAFIGYLIFTIFMTVGAAKVNKVLFVIFSLIVVLFLFLSLSAFDIAYSTTHMVAAVAELFIAIASFYGCAANVLNQQVGRSVLPLGKPLLSL